jgi:hypothetical protein
LQRKNPKTQKQAPKTQEPPMVLPPLPSGPLTQLPMEQIPSNPAKVSYQGGLLTISAENSSLGEILRDVRKLTGASIEIPQGSAGANERVVTHIGPGSPRDVLAVLLNGSSYNYVMVGSNSNPTSVASVVLSAKPSAAGDAPPAGNVYQDNSNSQGPMAPGRFHGPPGFNQQNLVAQQPGNGQPGVGQPAQPDSGDDAKDDDTDAADDNADDQAQPGQAVPDPTAANAADQPAQPDPNQPNAGPKTPEQILEMLRKQPQPGAPAVPAQQPPQQ